MYKNNIKKSLDEALSREEITQIKDEVIKTLKSSDLEKVISALVSKEIKGNKDLEKETLEITRNALTQLYKTLYTKHTFWSSQIK